MGSRSEAFYPAQFGGRQAPGWQSAMPGPGPGGMYDDFSSQPGMQRAGTSGAGGHINDLIYGAGGGFIKSGLGAYGDRLVGSSKEFMHNNVGRYFTGQDVRYYFQVNEQYVKNKLKILLFPSLHRGHWTRIAEQVAGGLTYKAPRNDINAPDLYVPAMAFGTYVVLSSIAIMGFKSVGPDLKVSNVLGERFTWALLAWILDIFIMRSSLYTLGSTDAPILDLVAYSGYSFVGISFSILAGMAGRWAGMAGRWIYWLVMAWTSLCMAFFLVKTMKRVLFAEARNYDRDPNRSNYMILFIAVVQFPMFLWLGYV
eukprot:TRINITY_DN3116_c0_g1_i1.p1 TRINITY_DN3116_c0_g1~~TRINITY_DN3116_c0_g1_i1.p1  ORF type:complete len:312 (+),score=35.82 TRINITY_DN3116_c0_g1_i1:158-1093(+)